MFFPGLLFLWIVFHLYSYIVAKKEKRDYFSQGNYRDENGKLVLWKVMVPFTRGFIQGMIQLTIALCFYFAGLSGINGGIISAIFACGVIFVGVIFYFKHG